MTDRLIVRRGYDKIYPVTQCNFTAQIEQMHDK